MCNHLAMTTPVMVTQHFPADAFRTFRLLVDPAYIDTKCLATGSLKTTCELTGQPDTAMTVRTDRVLPANVPSVAKSFVGETIEVTEIQEWTAPLDDGSRSAVVSVRFSGPLRFEGTAQLMPTASGCTITTVGKMIAKVPFVGGTIEEEAARQTERYLRTEETLAAEWLGGP